jgi:murein DD-endopeptidase MepM/ murein hydrolase activator NlpD
VSVRPSRRLLVLIAACLAAVAVHAVGGAAPIDIAVAARSIAPGELAVVTLKTDAAATAPAVRVFGKQAPAFQLEPGVWQSLVGIDLDQKPGSYAIVAIAHAGGVEIRGEQRLVVQAKTFPTRKLRVDPTFVNPPPDELKRIEREAAFVRDVTQHSASERLWSAPFVRPVPDAANSRFGSRSVFNGEPRRPHGGADFLSAAGTPIHAPNAGRIVAARDLFFTGNTVIIDHGLGVVSLMAHLSEMNVREGDRISAGQVIGRVGATGRVTGPHLHWGVTVAGARVDPLSVLALIGEKRAG